MFMLVTGAPRRFDADGPEPIQQITLDPVGPATSRTGRAFGIQDHERFIGHAGTLTNSP